MADASPTRRPGHRRPAPARRRPRWPLVVASVALAVLLGVVAGMSVPVDGRTAWPELAKRVSAVRISLPVMPWQRRGVRNPELVKLALQRPWFKPSERLQGKPAIPVTPPFGPEPLPVPWNAPAPPSRFRQTLLPLLGPDPLALPPYLARVLHDRRLRPRGIEPLARLAHVPILMYHDVVEGKKDVWFDLTVAEFDEQLALFEREGVQPISLQQWWGYITRADPLPPKPILLTFDDGYASVYHLIYPRLKARGWPAVAFLCPPYVGVKTTKDHITWDQAREMAASGLIEFQAHSMTHPYLTRVPDAQLRREVYDCRDAIEQQLGRPVQFFCYPIGDRDARVIQVVKEAGFVAGFTMHAGGSAQSPGMMEINRYACQDAATAVALANGTITIAAPPMWPEPDLQAPLTFHRIVFNEYGNRIPICWLTGGRPITVHADYRYAVPDVARLAGATAGINGGFFQMAHIRDTSNAMLGPVLASWTTERDPDRWGGGEYAEPRRVLPYGRFVPGNEGDNARLAGRPLVLMSRNALRFVPFDPAVMNSRRALELLLPGVTEAFIGGGWLVRDGHALSRYEMDEVSTRDHADPRRRAFFGIDRRGRCVIGASPSSQTSETIARCLEQLGVAQAVLLDSGFSSSLYYNGSILVTGHSDEKPSRAVPHLILVYPPDTPAGAPLGQAASKVEALWRWARGDDQSGYLPPRSRLVDRPADEPGRRRRRR